MSAWRHADARTPDAHTPTSHPIAEFAMIYEGSRAATRVAVTAAPET